MDTGFECLSLKKKEKREAHKSPANTGHRSILFQESCVNALFVLVFFFYPAVKDQHQPKMHRANYKEYHLEISMTPHCVRERGCWTGEGWSRLPNAWKCDGRTADEEVEEDGRLNSTCSMWEALAPSLAVPHSGPSESKCSPCMCNWKKQEFGRPWLSWRAGEFPQAHWELSAKSWGWSWTGAEGQQLSEPDSCRLSMGGREKWHPNSCCGHSSPHSSDKPIISSPSG